MRSRCHRQFVLVHLLRSLDHTSDECYASSMSMVHYVSNLGIVAVLSIRHLDYGFQATATAHIEIAQVKSGLTYRCIGLFLPTF